MGEDNYATPRGREEFISEPLTPAPGSGSRAIAARGEPGLPAQFTWRGTKHTVALVHRAWKTSAPEGGREGNERYLRRHYWTLTTTDGLTLTIYCLRQARPGHQRWFVYTLHHEESGDRSQESESRGP